MALAPGETGSLALVLLGSVDLTGVDVRLSFDAERLEVVSLEPGRC